LDFILTAGQASDIGQAEALLQLTPSGAGALCWAIRAMTVMRLLMPSGNEACKRLFRLAATE
jgi:hypothetical protein